MSNANMKLSILIATMGRRNDRFIRLLDSLMPQVVRHRGDIEVVTYWNNGELPIGEIRQALMESAKGEYICFLDDDDAVPDYYCDEIIGALGKDYVGFKMQVFNDGVELPYSFNSLRYDRWHEDERGYYRNVTHLNPIKKSIAMEGKFVGGMGEDEAWARKVHPKTENYIDKVMYYYYHQSKDTSFGSNIMTNGHYARPELKYKYFRYHNESVEKGGDMRPIEKCRACYSEKLLGFLDLGKQRLSDFREDSKKPPKWPLEAVMCDDCKLVQLRHSVPQPEMYHDRYGFKSGVSDSIKADLKDIVSDGLGFVKKPSRWLDIASNDGTLLSYVPSDAYRVGVDPVGFLCEEAEQHADRIINDYFSSVRLTEYMDDGSARYDKFDVITSISCFYDMPDPARFVLDVKAHLGRGGIWIIQQNYLLTTLNLGAIDNFCHEHLQYYTLLSLENLLKKYDLEVVDVKTTMVNGGSIRTAVAHCGAFPVNNSVKEARKVEEVAGLERLEPYEKFAGLAVQKLDELGELVKGLKSEGNSIAILAASTRGATIWQAADLDAGTVDYAVERNPAKVGKEFSAIGVPIISEEEARKRKPDYMIIGPWFFADEIIKREEDYVKAGGRLILPLPNVEVIDAGNLASYL